jgi:hypothetical protein
VFLYGESMGGNITLRLLLQGQATQRFAGGILVAPMTQIGEDVMPPAWQVTKTILLVCMYFTFLLLKLLNFVLQIPLLRLASKMFPASALIPNKVAEEGCYYKFNLLIVVFLNILCSFFFFF